MKGKLLTVFLVALVILVSTFLYFTNDKNQKDLSLISDNYSTLPVGEMMGVSGVFDETRNVYIGSEVVFKLTDGKEVSYILREDTTVEPLKYNCLGVRDCASWNTAKRVLFVDYEDLQHKLECKHDDNWCRQNRAIWEIKVNNIDELLNIKELNASSI